jgi:hypothetical protein
MMVESANAQSIPKPSVPEFTAKYVDRSFIVPASTSIDPYTGQNVTHPSYFVENRTLELDIKNQPFTPYTIDNSTGSPWNTTLMYNVQTKGHFAVNWTVLYSVDNGFFPASSSHYTTVSYTINERPVFGNLQPNSQVDFQVEAFIGYVSRTIGFASWYFTGESSGWSSTQTITIPAVSVSTSTPSPTSSSNPTTAPTSTPTTTNLTGNPISVPLNTLIVVVAIFLVIIVALSLLLFRKHRKIISQNKPNV